MAKAKRAKRRSTGGCVLPRIKGKGKAAAKRRGKALARYNACRRNKGLHGLGKVVRRRRRSR